MTDATRFFSFLALFLIVVLNNFGCRGSKTPDITVAGTVTLDNAPLPKGVINIAHSETGRAYSTSVENGEFRFSVPVSIGDYKVGVRYPTPGAMGQTEKISFKIPEKYFDQSKSGLNLTVAKGMEPAKLLLSSK